MHQVIELELPKPGPNQVRVRIVTSGINPTDSKTRAWHAGRTPNRFQVQHHDGSGVVDAVGSDVVGVPVWQRVWLHVAAFGNHYGTAAEYALFPAARAAPLPDVSSDDLATCLGLPALTAAHSLGGKPEALKGRTDLVAGGAGAVDHSIELAKHTGARVVATVSSDEEHALAEAAGFDMVVRYTDADASQQIRGLAARVDRTVEVAIGANLNLDLAVVATRGAIASHAAAGELTPPRRTVPDREHHPHIRATRRGVQEAVVCLGHVDVRGPQGRRPQGRRPHESADDPLSAGASGRRAGQAAGACGERRRKGVQGLMLHAERGTA
ncbi:hypothetical protein OPAG_06680 [Rhodococcus opacus PD630]|nr:hypothetical protein OPAG_06680 [Rhodococcus opacus PD630]